MKVYNTILSSLIIIIGILNFGDVCFAQELVDLHTPKGTFVQGKDYIAVYGEYSASEQIYWDNYWTSGYNNITIIETSTLSYNCHGFAWHVSEGGFHVWIDDMDELGDIDNVNRYWDDYSYVETGPTSTPGRKVFYLILTQG